MERRESMQNKMLARKETKVLAGERRGKQKKKRENNSSRK